MTNKQQDALRPTTNEDSKLRLHALTTEILELSKEDTEQVQGGGVQALTSDNELVLYSSAHRSQQPLRVVTRLDNSLPE